MTLKQSKRHSVIRTLNLWTSCFALSACALFGKEPTPKPLDLHWHFFEVVPGETMACLPQKGVEVLRKAIVECGHEK